MQHLLLRGGIGPLKMFMAVAHHRSFTRAAAQLGLSQSAVSHAMRALEETMGTRLLARTSRSVALTEQGEAVLLAVGPHIEAIEAEMTAVAEMGDEPAGSIRITASDHSIRTVLSPKLRDFLPRFPSIKVELHADNGLVDLADQRFDAGVRLGETVAQDMIAVRISPDVRFTVIATKAYFKAHGIPRHPQELVAHNCINYRTATHGGLWAWEFEQDGRELNVRVEGQVIYNSIYDCLDAAIAGLGVAYVPAEIASAALQRGELATALTDWTVPWSGFHLYYPSRRQPSGAMAVLIAALRHPS